MSGIALDHVVIRTPDPDVLLARVSDITGLPVLRGWTPGGHVHSRGVRFGNGPFLDVFADPTSPPRLLGLAGDVAAAEREAERAGWGVKVRRDAPVEPPYEPEPWSVLMFRKGQAALSGLFVIDYDRGHPSWATQEFSGELLKPELADPGAARLARVWIAADAAMDDALPALGLSPRGDRIFDAAGVDVVLCDPVAERPTVVRFDVEGGRRPGMVALAPGLTLSAR